eukprot:8710925-Alexandrium_andersonii.AAC.1
MAVPTWASRSSMWRCCAAVVCSRSVTLLESMALQITVPTGVPGCGALEASEACPLTRAAGAEAPEPRRG